MTPRIRGRFRLRRGEQGETQGEYIRIDAAELTGVFAPPGWLRDLGLLSWLFVGVAVAVVGLVALAAITEVIVIPVIVAAIIASVSSPLMEWMQRIRIPRAVGAGLILVAMVLIVLGVTFLVLDGITSETAGISSHLQHAADRISGWATDLGVDSSKADSARDHASTSATNAFHALIGGLGSVLGSLASLVFFLAMVVLSLFFLLKDGPTIRRWSERHMGVPLPVAETISLRVIGSLRGYFLGVTIISAYNAVVIGLGALLIGVPLAGTIAIVTFFASYIPYLGAWGAGAFAVLIALSGGGADAAVEMAIVALLANGILQQMVQPFAYGAALGIHPLAVLVVTIAGGAIFGTIGLILAAPVTSAVTRISADLAKARAAENAAASEAGPPPPGRAPPAPEPAG